MYLDLFKLHDLPFRLSPDPQYLYLSRNHSRAKAYMESTIWFTDGFVIITGGIELSVQQVRCNGMFGAWPGVARQASTPWPSDQFSPPHQAMYPMDAARVAPCVQIPPHPASTIGPVTLGKAGTNRCRQPRIDLRPGTLRPLQPSIEPASCDLQCGTQP